jgi:flagellar motor switch protein FliN/FliY
VAIRKPSENNVAAELEPLVVTTDPVAAQEPRIAIPTSKIDSVVVTLSVELGRTEFLIRDLKSLRQSQVVPLERAVGDPVDIRVNGKLVARGEVVATEGNKYGVRITEIVPSDAPMPSIAGVAVS